MTRVQSFVVDNLPLISNTRLTDFSPTNNFSRAPFLSSEPELQASMHYVPCDIHEHEHTHLTG